MNPSLLANPHCSRLPSFIRTLLRLFFSSFLPFVLPFFFLFFVLFFLHFPASSWIYSAYSSLLHSFCSPFVGLFGRLLSVPLSKIFRLEFCEAGRRWTVATAAWPIHRTALLSPYTRTCSEQPFGRRKSRKATALWSTPTDPGLCREVPVYRFRGSSVVRTVFPAFSDSA